MKDAVITPCQNMPRCIALTRDEELIFSDSDNRAVNVVRHGKFETLIITPSDWLPWGLHCSRSGDMLVHIVMLYTVQNCLCRRITTETSVSLIPSLTPRSSWKRRQESDSDITEHHQRERRHLLQAV